MGSSNGHAGTDTLNDADVERVVKEVATRYAPIINLDQACEIALESKATMYEWSSQGRLDDCKARPGRRLKFMRDRFVRFLLTR